MNIYSGIAHTLKEGIADAPTAHIIIYQTYLHTLPGLANAAASALDAMNMSVVLGTLAGDDTVFVVMRDGNAAAAFCGEIKGLLS